MGEGRTRIGVALSGGGHRAALFGLGALLYLIDAGKGPQISTVASVSGGSLTNAYVGHTADLTCVEPAALWANSRTLAGRIARRGTLWAAPITYVYLGSMALLVMVALVASACTPWWAALVVWLAIVAVCGWMSQKRSAVVAAAFNATLFHRTRLSEMRTSVAHVLCATDLQMGQTVYFSSDFVYSFRTGWGVPGDLSTARAAQASAALPGAFSVVQMPVSRFGLPKEYTPDRHPPQRFKLLDGGVYDNMGSEWLLGMAERIEDGDSPPTLHPVDEVVVINASAGDEVTPRPWVAVPYVGEIFSLLAVKDVMYRQTTAVRRRLLNLRYRIARDQQRGRLQPPAAVSADALAGVTVQISQSPFEIPDDYSKGDDAFAARSAAAIELIGTNNRESWKAETNSNQHVKTTLSKIETSRARALIRHGYVLTMVNSHVLLDYPLRPIPADDEFSALVG